jgi:hypothetical protein
VALAGDSDPGSAQPNRGQLARLAADFWRRALLGKLRRRQMGDEVPDSLRALASLLAPA